MIVRKHLIFIPQKTTKEKDARGTKKYFCFYNISCILNFQAFVFFRCNPLRKFSGHKFL